jgi:hypothetical protein
MRIIRALGTVQDGTRAIITADNQIVAQGHISNVVSLFNFAVPSQKQGKVKITIQIVEGSITVTNYRAVYSAIAGDSGLSGFVDGPVALIQPNLPFTVCNLYEYDFYILNGVDYWCISSNQRYVTVDSWPDAVTQNIIKPVWGYDHNAGDVSELINSGLRSLDGDLLDFENGLRLYDYGKPI